MPRGLTPKWVIKRVRCEFDLMFGRFRRIAIRIFWSNLLN